MKKTTRTRTTTTTVIITVASLAALGAMLIFATVERPLAASALKRGETPIDDRLHGKLYDMVRTYEVDRDLLTPKWHYGWSFDDNVKALRTWWCTSDDDSTDPVPLNPCKTPAKDFAAFSLWYKEHSRRAYFIDAITPGNKYTSDKTGMKQLLSHEYRKLSKKEHSEYRSRVAVLKGTPAPTGKIDTHIDRYYTRLAVVLYSYEGARDVYSYKWSPANTDAQNTNGLNEWWCPANPQQYGNDCSVPMPENFDAFAIWYKAHAKEVFYNKSIDGEQGAWYKAVKEWLAKEYNNNNKQGGSKNYRAYNDEKVRSILLKTRSGF
jgi:hypothetical protein